MNGDGSALRIQPGTIQPTASPSGQFDCGPDGKPWLCALCSKTFREHRLHLVPCNTFRA